MERHKAPGLPLAGHIIGVAHDPILLMVLAHHNMINDPNKAILPMTYHCAYLVSCDSVEIEEVVSMNHIPEGSILVSPIEFLKAVDSKFLKAANELLKTNLFEFFLPEEFPDFGNIIATEYRQFQEDVIIHSPKYPGAIVSNKVLAVIKAPYTNEFEYRVELFTKAPLMPKLILKLLKEGYPVLPYDLVEEAATMLVELGLKIKKKT